MRKEFQTHVRPPCMACHRRRWIAGRSELFAFVFGAASFLHTLAEPGDTQERRCIAYSSGESRAKSRSFISIEFFNPFGARIYKPIKHIPGVCGLLKLREALATDRELREAIFLSVSQSKAQAERHKYCARAMHHHPA